MSKPLTKRILVHIPTNFLQEFDKEISGIYASRSEAVRAGMIIVMETEKKQQHHKQQKIQTPN
ncbi:MAG: ribbon-helix-helix domain-containing protein [Nitrososphaerota archaeon]|jgi:metal-responsive CopG/Arc/MetJ family transcriptional regulator|nr:ribbon-helix-helix domain-containing protein [Nitrososphaerota archaeon]